jgi:hypothetical protein
VKAIRLTIDQWQNIVIEIAKHHPRSVWMVRPKMRKVLGFTPREHEEWVTFDHTGPAESPRKYLKKEIHLDFYDESKRTMFLLKYSDFINSNNDNRLY